MEVGGAGNAVVSHELQMYCDSMVESREEEITALIRGSEVHADARRSLLECWGWGCHNCSRVDR